MPEIKSKYCLCGLKAYKSTHIEILAVNGNYITYRHDDELRGHEMTIDELNRDYEILTIKEKR